MLLVLQSVLTWLHACSSTSTGHVLNLGPPFLIANYVMLLKASSTGARLARFPSCRLFCGRPVAVHRAVPVLGVAPAFKGAATGSRLPAFTSISRGMADSAQVPKAAALQEVDTDVFTTNPLLAVSNHAELPVARKSVL